MLIGTPEWKRPLRIPWSKREDDIKMDLETGCEGVDWIHLAHHRNQWHALVNTVMNLLVPQKAGNYMRSWATISFMKLNGYSNALYQIPTHLSWVNERLRMVECFLEASESFCTKIPCGSTRHCAMLWGYRSVLYSPSVKLWILSRIQGSQSVNISSTWRQICATMLHFPDIHCNSRLTG
jgi:hypothetical protein